MNATKAKRRLAVAALAVLTALAILVARHSPFRRSLPRPAQPVPTEPDPLSEVPVGPSASDVTEEDLDPPLDKPEPVWPESGLRPPRPVRLPPPTPPDPAMPSAESSLAAPAAPTLLFDASAEFDAFGTRLLRERGRGVEIVFLASQEDASEELAEAALSAARQVRLLFPRARFGASVLRGTGTYAEPLGAPDEAWGGALAGHAASRPGDGGAAAFALASRMDWTPRGHRHAVVLMRRMPDLAEAAMLVAAARDFTARTGVGVRCFAWGAASPGNEASASLLSRTDALHYSRLDEPNLLGRELLAAMLGSEDRGRIERILDAAEE